MLSVRTGNSERKANIAALDGVRAIACIGVVEYHVHLLLSRSFHLPALVGKLGSSLLLAGWSGVTLFFVLSGFLLFLPYARHLLFEQQRPGARTFYVRRALRILPGYYLALFLLIALTHPQYLKLDHLGSLGLFLTLLMDAPSTYQQINGPFWTLAVECQFYVLLPFIAWGFGLCVRRAAAQQQRLWRLVICIVGMILWGIGTRYVGNYYTLHPAETLLVVRPVLNGFLALMYGASGKYLEDFAIGMLCCTLYLFAQNAAQNDRIGAWIHRHNSLIWGAGILLLFFMSGWSAYLNQLIFLVPFIGAHSFLTEIGFATGFGLCITAILFGPRGLRLLFESHPLRWLGSISYSMYLWHLPMLIFFKEQVIDKLRPSFPSMYLLYWAYVLFLIIPCTYLLYRFVEVHWMKLGSVPRSQAR